MIIKKGFLGFVLIFLQLSISFSNTIQSTAAGGNWSLGSTWVGGIVPSSGDVVIIVSTATVTANINATVSKLDIFGTLNIKDGITLTVTGDVIVETTGHLNMPGGSGSATLLVYGNYTTYGVSDFWKSDVVVAGNFISPNSTGVQNIGNLVVGGDLIGNIDLTGGTGTNQIYTLNPNATVNITPSSVNNSTTISSPPESSSLISAVNTVIYGGSCTYTINGPSNTTACLNGNASFSVTTTAGTPTYQWEEYNGTSWSTLANAGIYSTVNAFTLHLTGVTSSMNGYRYRCKITDNTSCIKNSYYAILTVGSTPAVGTPVFTLGTSSSRCKGAGTLTYTATASNTTGISYSLDASSLAAGNTINSTNGAVTYTAGWIGNSTITASAAGCGGPLTAIHTVTTNPLPTAITGPTSVCTGKSVSLSSSPSGGNWTSSNTSKATVNISTGVVSGIAAGSCNIIYTLSTGCSVSTSMQVSLTPDTGVAYRKPNN